MDLGMNKYMLHQLPISLDKSCFEVMKGLSSQGSVIWKVSGQNQKFNSSKGPTIREETRAPPKWSVVNLGSKGLKAEFL